MKPANGLLPAALLLAATAGAEPGSAGQSTTSATNGAIDVVTIIGRQSDASDVPGSAHVVDAAALAVFNASDILRVLQTVPGVYVQEEEGFGLRPNIGIRGSGLDRSARIALLEDGVLIAPAPYAAASAYYFPTQRRMSAVEVLKGPAAVAIGPRTTGGAINLISTPIPQSSGANLDVRVGDHGGLDAHVNVARSGPRLSWLLETVQAESDGFKTIDAADAPDTGYELRDYVGKLKIDSAPGSALYQSLRVKIGRTRQDSNETYLGLTDADFASDPYRRYAASARDHFSGEHEQVQATWVIDPGGRWRGKLTAYRNDFSRNWYKLQSVDGASLNSVLSDPAGFADEYAYLTGAASPDEALRVRANKRSYLSRGLQGTVERDFDVAGAEVMLNAGFRLHEDEEDRFQHEDAYRMDDGTLVLTTAGAPGSQSNRVSSADVRSAFVDAEIHANRWIFTPGLRYEDIELTRLDFATSDPARAAGATRVRETKTGVAIPGFGALYRVTPGWRLLGGIHKGYNPPAPGSSADAETSVNVELGTRFENASLAFEAIYFVNDYDNLVGTVTESTGGGGQVGDQFDGGAALVRGLELSIGARPVLGAFELPLDLRYTWTSKAEFENAFESDFDPWGDVEAGDALPYIPEHQLRATAGVETDRLRLNLAASYVGKMRTRASQGPFDPATTIDSHVVWDLMGAWNLTPKLAAYLKVDNVFDETYVAARRPAGSRPGLPRTAYLGVRWSL